MTKQNKHIDLALSVMCSLAQYGQTLSRVELAEICECSHHTIRKIELRALEKIKQSDMLSHYYQEQ